MPKLSSRKVQSRNNKRNLLQNEKVVQVDNLLVAVPTTGCYNIFYLLLSF